MSSHVYIYYKNTTTDVDINNCNLMPFRDILLDRSTLTKIQFLAAVVYIMGWPQKNKSFYNAHSQ